MKRGPPTESATTDARGAFAFNDSAMDEFELAIEGARPWRRKFRFAELKSSVTITLP